MAIRIQWEGGAPVAVCDTVAEARELLQHPGPAANGNAPKIPGEALRVQGNEEKARNLSRLANVKSKNIMRVLLDNQGGIEGEQLSKTSGIDIAGIGGVLGSLSKAAEKSGFLKEQVVLAETRMDGRRRYRWYAPGKVLLEQRNKIL